MLSTPLSGAFWRSSAAILVATALVCLSALVVTSAPAPAAGESAMSGSAAEPVLVSLRTSEGEIVLELDARRAPQSVENFLGYVDAGFYDGTIFHRVIEGFMIQGGGFTADFARKPTGEPVRNEANNGLSNLRYTIAMARTNAPHSATAQFFINTDDNPNLDHTATTPRGWGYAVFGRVIEGQEVVESISRVATGAGGPFSRDAPREPLVIVAARRIEEPSAAADESESASGEAPVTTTARPTAADTGGAGGEGSDEHADEDPDAL